MQRNTLGPQSVPAKNFSSSIFRFWGSEATLWAKLFEKCSPNFLGSLRTKLFEIQISQDIEKTVNSVNVASKLKYIKN